MKKIITISILVLVFTLSIVAVAVAINNNINNQPIDNSNVGDSFVDLKSDRTLVDRQIEIEELKGDTKVNKITAIQKAKEFRGEEFCKGTAGVTAVKAKFTDNETPIIDDKAVKERPAWMVTFKNVPIPTNGGFAWREGTSQRNRIVMGDSTVVIDADSGEMIEMISVGNND